MTVSTAWLVLLGLVLSLGIGLTVSGLPANRRLRFADRVAPQLRIRALRSGPDPSSQSSVGGLLGVLRELLLPAATRLASTRLPWIGIQGDENLVRRLARTGRAASASDFRTDQVVWGLVGAGCALFLAAAGWLSGSVPPVSGLFLLVVGAALGGMAPDYLLTRAIAAREKRMLEEFPALAELMALSVTAGESTLGALERICRSGTGDLTDEFRIVLDHTRSGTGVVDAFQDFSRRIGLPTLSRFVDGITVAVERGTPLAEVLRAQAQDVRDETKRELMELAGRKEIAMMAPVVFLILPLTVVFAVFPGLSMISVGL